MDPGKGSKRRPTDKSKFDQNFDRIFAPKQEKIPGRRYYRQVKNEDGTTSMVEVENPPPKFSEDIRFEGSFCSPVDGSRIASRADLLDHNARHNVTQILPGMEQDQEAIRKDNYDKAFGKQAKKQRIEDVKRAIENPIVKERPKYEPD